MADTKLSDLSSGAPAAATDIIYAVKDPSGTPADAKLTLGEVKTLVNTPGGSDTQVQFNDGGAFAGDSGFTFNKTAKTLTLTGATITTSSPVIDAAQTWNASGTTFTGLKLNVTDTASASASLLMDLQFGGTSVLSVGKNAFINTAGALMGFGVAGTLQARFYSNLFALGNTVALAFSSSAPTTGTQDTFLTRRGAANLRLGAADAASPVAQTLSVQSVVAGTTNTAGTNLTITGSQGTGTGAGGSIIFQVAPAGSSGTAQNSLVTFLEATSARAFNLYNTTDATTNFERGKIAWESNALRIGTEKGGTGTARALEFQTDGTTRLTIAATGGLTISGGINAQTGATFLRELELASAQYLAFTSRFVCRSPSDGVLTVFNYGQTDFNRLQFGGTTSSFPALKRSSATLQVRLADDSAYAKIEALNLTNGRTIQKFTPLDNQPPATNFATLDTRNSVATLDFDDGATNEEAVFVGVIPEGAILTSGIKVRVFWAATSATSGACRWGAQFEKYGTDIDSDSFDTATEGHSTTSGTSGIVNVTELTCTTIDSLTAGDQFRIKIYRDSSDTTNDTMTGDAELIAVELQQVA